MSQLTRPVAGQVKYNFLNLDTYLNGAFVYDKKFQFGKDFIIEKHTQAAIFSDGLWYVYCGELPHAVSAQDTPDVYGDKWACVGKLCGHEVCSTLNYKDTWGVSDDSDTLKLAIYSTIRTGYARFCINAGVSVTLLKEVVIPFSLDNVPVSYRLHGETAIGSLGRVSELVVKLGIRGLVSEVAQLKLDHFTMRQWTGFANQKVVSVTQDTMTVERNPWPDTEAVIWALRTNSYDGVVYDRFFQITTDRGGYLADGYRINSDGTCTFTNVHPIGQGQDLKLATRVNFFESHANRLQEGSYSDDSAIIHLAVAENPFVNNIWVLACYRAFAHSFGSGSGPNTLMGNMGVWSDIIVDNALYFISNTNINPDSPQGINNGLWENIQLSNVRYGIRARRCYNFVFNNVQHIYSVSGEYCGVMVHANEIEGITTTGYQGGWTKVDWVHDTWTPKLFKCTRLRHVTVSGCMFGRHDPNGGLCRGAIIDVKDGAMFNVTVVGNTMVSVDENQKPDNFGWFEANEIKNVKIADNAVGYKGEYGGSNVLSFRTATNNIINLEGSYFGQPVKTNAEMGIYDVQTASMGNCFWSVPQFRDAGGMLSYADVNNSTTWPDSRRTIIPFGGTLSSTVQIGLLDKGTLEGFHRDTVAVDLRSVNFSGHSVQIMDGSVISKTVTQAGLYLFKLVGQTYIPI